MSLQWLQFLQQPKQYSLRKRLKLALIASLNKCVICQKILKAKHLWHTTFTVSGGLQTKLFNTTAPESPDKK